MRCSALHVNVRDCLPAGVQGFSVLQCVAVRCSAMRCRAIHVSFRARLPALGFRVLVGCSGLQCVAVRCSALHVNLRDRLPALKFRGRGLGFRYGLRQVF